MQTKELSIIIVNYNTKDYVEKCINSIPEYLKSTLEIVVVDNASINRDIMELEKVYKDIKLIYSEKNNGFGYGCNLGVRKTNSKYLLFLNPDIKVIENSIEILLKYLKSNINAGVVSGILINDFNQVLYSYNSFPNLKWEFYQAFGLFLKKTIRELTSRIEIKNNIPFEVDWFHGACMMMRRDVFEKVGGFDENIFLYYEDVDIQKKIKDCGYKNICIPQAKFYHLERSSVRGEGFDKVYHFYMHISKIYYYKKYYSTIQVLKLRMLYIAGILVKIFIFPFRPRIWSQILTRFKEYAIILSVYTNIKKNI